MKPSSLSSVPFFFLIIILFASVQIQAQQTDSCTSNLNLKDLPFDSTSLQCLSVWNNQGFVLRYAQTSPNLWSFVLSAPDPGSYIAMGFSADGLMVGSSAIVGWISSDGGGGTVKQYFLGGKKQNLVVPDQGNLQVVNNSTRILSQASRMYLVFQLRANQPSSRVLYAVGPAGFLPSAPSFELSEHRDKVSTSVNYVTGESASERQYTSLRKGHGMLNMVGWGILMVIGVIVSRFLKKWDPIWYYSHATIQSLGFMLGFIGILLGLLLENRLSVDVSTHKGIGIFILVLACLQVTSILARPKKEVKMRKYWNWYHHNVGRTLIIFAIANVFYGIHLGEKGSGWKAGYGVVIAMLLVIAAILEIKMWIN